MVSSWCISSNFLLQQIVVRIRHRDCLDRCLLIGLNLYLNVAHVNGVVFQDVSIFSDDILHSPYSDLQSSNIVLIMDCTLFLLGINSLQQQQTCSCHLWSWSFFIAENGVSNTIYHRLKERISLSLHLCGSRLFFSRLSVLSQKTISTHSIKKRNTILSLLFEFYGEYKCEKILPLNTNERSSIQTMHLMNYNEWGSHWTTSIFVGAHMTTYFL